MRLIVDANVVLAAILGRRGRLRRAITAGIELFVPEAQMGEVALVLTRKLGVAPETAQIEIADTTSGVAVIETRTLEPARVTALARLPSRGAPDWPVLAAAVLLDADIWSDDRDFFGVGVATWSRDTIDVAIGLAAAA